MTGPLQFKLLSPVLKKEVVVSAPSTTHAAKKVARKLFVQYPKLLVIPFTIEKENVDPNSNRRTTFHYEGKKVMYDINDSRRIRHIKGKDTPVERNFHVETFAVKTK